MNTLGLTPDRLAGAIALVARDAWQRAPHRAVSGLAPDDPGPPNDLSLSVQRFLLRRLYPTPAVPHAPTGLDRPRRVP